MASGWPDPNLWPWTKFESEDPTQYYDPPDDIWSQCGIQFQVVLALQFDAPHQEEPVLCSVGGRNFYPNDQERDALINGMVGPASKKLLVDDLQPVFANFGYLPCGFYGNWVSNSATIEIDRADSSPPSNVVAHELSHVLLGAGHESDPENLKAGFETNGHTLTAAQCVQARDEARWFASRFWTYNATIGRVPARNPYTPTYVYGEDPAPITLEYSCCQSGGEKAWVQAAICLYGDGDILPDSECTVCCQIAQSPPDAAYRPLGGCPEQDVILKSWCDKVCCEIDTQFQLTSKLKCENTPGAAIALFSACPPR